MQVKAACEARKSDGSVLEYGLDKHLEDMVGALEKGLPNDPRFFERDLHWVDARTKEQTLLVEFLADFQSKLGEYDEARPVIAKCNKALVLFQEKVGNLKVTLEIQKAVNARTKEGSCLEYGLKSHLERLNGEIQKGPPKDPRFPERGMYLLPPFYHLVTSPLPNRPVSLSCVLQNLVPSLNQKTKIFILNVWTDFD
jgi:hypothetical protein